MTIHGLYDQSFQGESFYELKEADVGVCPVTSIDFADHLKIGITDIDDSIVQIMLAAATFHAERFTARDFRINTWTLLVDTFSNPIQIVRPWVAAISAITHIVSGTPVTVANSVYYLKRGIRLSKILLDEDMDWPTDTDNRDQAIEIRFTRSIPASIDLAKIGILEHAAFMYANRGDCNCASAKDVANAAKQSGAEANYSMLKIARV